VLNLENKYHDIARIFKAFCDENRLIILEMLQSGEKCACVLLERLNITQPTLSHHMKILFESGIVTPRKEGKWTYYSLAESGSENAIEILRAITTVTEDKNAYKGCCE
jgi:ArsR family transcriptional regulator